MSTVPQTATTRTRAAIKTAALKVANKPYFKQPATVLQILSFVLPFLGGFGLWLINMSFAVQSQGRDTTEIRATIQRWQDAKEERGSRMAVLERSVGDLRDDIKDLRTDVKTLLRAVGTVEGRGK